jgi:murein L,D-transpeptidase YcbB/YkuD
MLSKIIITVALVALVFVHFSDAPNAKQFAGQSRCSATSAAEGSNIPQKLSPAGVLRLRTLLTGLGGADGQGMPSDSLGTEAQEFYACLGYSLPWISGGRSTVQALTIIEELKHADEKGLNPEDYDGALWAARLAAFPISNDSSEEAEITFDLDLTVSTMRFLSDLHVGRVNPQSLHFDLSADGKSLDLSEFIQRELINGNDMEAAIESVEPQFLTYRRTLHALHSYLDLARNDSGEKLPAPTKAVHIGDAYSGLPRLVTILQTLGDLETPDTSRHSTYDLEIRDAVKRFQKRHGLDPNGLLDKRTLEQLNTPLRQRVLQLQLALERWRWLPQNFSRPPIIVNIPEFRLYAVNEDHHVVFSMNIVVGRAYHHETPVFTSEIRSVIFRPFWNVPLAIQRNEIVPQIKKNPDYLTENSYAVVDSRGRAVENVGDSRSLMDKLRSGEWRLRQEPGPDNSLGLIKFDLPDPFDVYLHGTPAQELFARSRRDFSHGCIRVEDPAALAAWVLRDNPQWTIDRIQSAMSGDDTLRVDLDKPVPAWILYGTAVVHEDGEVFFFEDIYGHDAALERALEQRKFPLAPVSNTPKLK